MKVLTIETAVEMAKAKFLELNIEWKEPVYTKETKIHFEIITNTKSRGSNKIIHINKKTGFVTKPRAWGGPR